LGDQVVVLVLFFFLFLLFFVLILGCRGMIWTIGSRDYGYWWSLKGDERIGGETPGWWGSVDRIVTRVCSGVGGRGGVRVTVRAWV
jgi:hypothetical protein